MEKSKSNLTKIKKNIIYLLVKIAIIVLTIYILLFLVFGIQIVNNQNMSPSIREGELLIYYRFDKDYKKGDVICTTSNNKKEVFRIVAIEDEQVNITEDGDLLVNGNLEKTEIYFKTIKDQDSKITYPYTVKKGEVFVMNDNRLNLNDSRTYGGIKNTSINGKVISKLQIRDF